MVFSNFIIYISLKCQEMAGGLFTDVMKHQRLFRTEATGISQQKFSFVEWKRLGKVRFFRFQINSMRAPDYLMDNVTISKAILNS